MITLELEQDGAEEIEASIQKIALGLTDLKPEIRAAAEYLAGCVEDRAEHTSSLFKALADSTEKARERRVAKGEDLVESIDTPLRAFGDSIRNAAIALREGVAGSVYQVTDDTLTFGAAEEDEHVPWMRFVLLGDPARNTPERNLMELPDNNLEKADEILQTGVDKIFVDAQ